jgi:hypothetical protein
VAAQEKAMACANDIMSGLQAKGLSVLQFGAVGADVEDKATAARDTADVIIAALDKLFATGFDPMQQCYTGEYSSYAGGGSMPFLVQLMGFLLVDGARPLAHALSKASVGAAAAANLRFTTYDYPYIYSLTPLLYLASLTTMADAMLALTEVGAGARVLIEAGADVRAKKQIVCKGGGSPHVQEPYEGPAYDHTLLMLLAFTKDSYASATAGADVFKLGTAGQQLLNALLAGGADANERDGEGKLVRESPCAPEAKAALDAAAAAAAAKAPAAAAAAAAAPWSCCGAADADK